MLAPRRYSMAPDQFGEAPADRFRRAAVAAAAPAALMSSWGARAAAPARHLTLPLARRTGDRAWYRTTWILRVRHGTVSFKGHLSACDEQGTRGVAAARGGRRRRSVLARGYRGAFICRARALPSRRSGCASSHRWLFPFLRPRVVDRNC